MRTYITLECVQKCLKVLNIRISDRNRHCRTSRRTSGLVDKLDSDATQVAGDGLDFLLLSCLLRNFALLALARRRYESRHLSGELGRRSNRSEGIRRRRFVCRIVEILERRPKPLRETLSYRPRDSFLFGNYNLPSNLTFLRLAEDNESCWMTIDLIRLSANKTTV